MYIVMRNTKVAVVLALVPIIVFAIVYFTVIKPDQNTANQVLTQSEKQVNQQVQQVQKSVGGVPASVQNLTACIAAAGTNTTAIEQCRVKFPQ